MYDAEILTNKPTAFIFATRGGRGYERKCLPVLRPLIFYSTTINMTRQKTSQPLMLIMALLLAAMTIVPFKRANSESVRTWLDERTAVSVTAQRLAWTFVRRDALAGKRVYDFADLGAFEVNQTGTRHQYLCLLEWITDPSLRKSGVVEDFSTLIVWADDKQLTFPRYTQNREMLLLSEMPFKKHTYNVIESYYVVTVAQLETMAEAKSFRIEAANQPTDAAIYKSANGEHASLVAFTREISNIAKLMNPASQQ